MNAKKTIAITLAMIILVIMPLLITGCGNDNSDEPPNGQTDDLTNAAPETEDNDMTEPELIVGGITVEIEEFALSVESFSGILHLSRPLETSMIQHFEETVSGTHHVWNEESGSSDEVEYEFNLNGSFEGFENIIIGIFNNDGMQVGSYEIGTWGYQLSPQSWIFDSVFWDEARAGTYTIRIVSTLYIFDISEIDDAPYSSHSVSTWYDSSPTIMEFEYDPVQLAVNCDYIEIAGMMLSPFTWELNLQRWSMEHRGMEVLNDESFIRLGLENFKYLITLSLFGNQISDLTPLAGLTNLESLNLSSQRETQDNVRGTPLLTDITPLAGLTNLKFLDLSDNQISDLTPLAGLTNLETLQLNNQREPFEIRDRIDYTSLLSDIAPLAGLINLIELNLSENRISDITPLTEMTSLESLLLSNQFEHTEGFWRSNLLSDIAPIAGLTNLIVLELSENRINDISPLVNLTNLESLRLNNQRRLNDDGRGYTNVLNDITSLAPMTSLKNLGISNNAINDLSPLTGMTNLETLSLFSNVINDLSPLTGMTKLTLLHLGHNEISVLTPLTGLTSLRSLDLSNSPLITDFAPLSELSNLETLSLSYSRIRDISSLAVLNNITSLELSGNEIRDLTPLSSLTNLGRLSLNSNQSISDFTPISELINLTSLDLTNTGIADISLLADLTSLTSLSLNRNRITDLTPLADLTNLNYVGLSGNDGITDWSPVEHVNSVLGRP